MALVSMASMALCFLREVFMAVLLFFLWIILNGRITLELVLVGAVVTAVVYFLACKALGYSMKKDLQLLRNLPVAIIYMVNLVLEIIKASVSVIALIWSGTRKPDPVFVEFHSGLKEEMQNVILANSITLTPGTYTVIQEGDYFLVHCLREEMGQGMSESSFVKLLRRVQ